MWEGGNLLKGDTLETTVLEFSHPQINPNILGTTVGRIVTQL